MKADDDKLDFNKLINVSTSLNNLKIKVDDLDVDKLKAVPVDLKKLSDVENNEVNKNTKFNKPKIKVNNLDKKIPDAITLIHTNQYNTGKQNSEKKIGYIEKKKKEKTDASDLVTASVLNTKISQVESKIPDSSSLVTSAILNTKITEFENKIPVHAKYITTQEFNKLRTENFAARLNKLI